MLFDNGGQLVRLFLSAGFGLWLGVYYDIFRLIRVLLKPGRRAVFAQDTAFFAGAAVFTFLFALWITNGEMRAYIWGGAATGFAAYRLTLGRVFVPAVAKILRALSALWQKIKQSVKTPVLAFWHKSAPKRQKFIAFLQKNLKKGQNNFIKGLKKPFLKVYNKQQSWGNVFRHKAKNGTAPPNDGTAVKQPLPPKR